MDFHVCCLTAALCIEPQYWVFVMGFTFLCHRNPITWVDPFMSAFGKSQLFGLGISGAETYAIASTYKQRTFNKSAALEMVTTPDFQKPKIGPGAPKKVYFNRAVVNKIDQSDATACMMNCAEQCRKQSKHPHTQLNTTKSHPSSVRMTVIVSSGRIKGRRILPKVAFLAKAGYK